MPTTTDRISAIPSITTPTRGGTPNVAARTVGVIVAGLAMIVNFAWLPYYPVWSTIVIAICIAIIWALTAQGRDIAS